jgi:hypothetical protein
MSPLRGLFAEGKMMTRLLFHTSPAAIVVSAAAFWLVGGRLAAQDQPPPHPRPDYGYFDREKRQTEERQKKDADRQRKVEEAARPSIDAQATASGGADQARRQHGASVGQMNDRLGKSTGRTPSPAAYAGFRLEPGMRVDVVTKTGATYTGTLVGIDGTKVRVQTIPDPAAKPSEFDLNNVAAFRTKDGMFAYNLRTGRFEPALAVYRLNRSTGNFERMESNYGIAFMTAPARVVGPGAGAVWGMVGIAPDGSLALGLPIPQSESPETIPAYHIQDIITSEGVYSYDEKKKDYTFKSHAQFAEEARRQRDAWGQAYYDREWARRQFEYALRHPPLTLMLPYYNAFLANAQTWPWWPLAAEATKPLPPGSGTPPP